MKVAIVYDWLNTRFGGGERTLLEIANLYPEAMVFTLLYDEARFGEALPPNRVQTSSLQNLPRFLRMRTRYLAQFIPRAMAKWDFSDYDLVISVSSAWAKNITVPKKTLHVSYCFSPMRFAWDHWPAYLDEQKVGTVRQFYIRWLVSRLRVWDFYGAQSVQNWLAISATSAVRIAKYYHATAQVIFPPVDTAAFVKFRGRPRQDYFLTLASLTPYKKLDIAIAACTASGVKLKVVGDGPDRARLAALAGPTIEFTGYVSDDERATLLGEAQALLFPQEEDFGISPIEAMAAGTPVIAYNKGGAAETVLSGETGVLYNDPTAEGLAQAMKEFAKLKFESKVMVAQAEKFDVEHFRKKFPAAIEAALQEFKHGS